MLPALFLPFGYPALWLLAGTALAVTLALARPAPMDTRLARRGMNALALCFIVYFLSFLVNTLYHGGSSRELDKPIRFLLGALLLFALTRAPVEPAVIRTTVVAAAVAAFGYALYDRLGNQAVRVGGFINEIQFGVLAAQVAALNAIFAIEQWRLSLRKVVVFAVAAAAGGTAAIMSGSLTAIMSLAALPLALLLTSWRRPSWRTLLVALAIFLATVALLAQSEARIVKRAMNAVEGVIRYDDHKSGSLVDSSSGARLENFANAWKFFLSSPFMGVGTQTYLSIRQEQIKRKELTEFAGIQGVAHNEYLDALAKRGVVGLAGLVVLLLGSVMLFRRACENAPAEGRAWAVCGLVVCIGLSIASLTQNVLTHSTGANFMVLTLAVFMRVAWKPAPLNAAASAAP